MTLDRFNQNTLRRSPFSTPILAKIFKGIVAVFTAGAGFTALFIFNTGSPLNDLAAPAPSVFEIIALLFSPYAGMFGLSWFLTGRGFWRALVALLGAVAVTGYGVYHLADFWFFQPRPIQGQALISVAFGQWVGLAAVAVTALAPGAVIGLFQNRQAGPAESTPTPPNRPDKNT